MFIEDLQVHIFPPWWQSGEASIKLGGTEAECARAGDLCASLGEDHYRPEQSVIAALEEVIVYLTHYGQVLFELLCEDDASVNGLWPFSPYHVYRLAGMYIQVLPRRSWRDACKKYIVLKPSSVWHIEMPRELGGPRGYVSVLKNLSTWPSLGPNFYTEDLERRELPKEFNFGDYRRAFEAYRYRATRTWGWNARDWSQRYITEYYQFHRFLTFRWAQAVLRSHVVTEFNRFLARIGISASVVLERLPSPGEILEARDRMARGEIDFAEASKITAPAKEVGA